MTQHTFENIMKTCGTCKYHHHEDIDDGYVCVNGDSEYVCDWTDDDFGCPAWATATEREGEGVRLV